MLSSPKPTLQELMA